MKFTITAMVAALTISFGSVQAAPVARIILNGDPGEFVGNGGFYDMTIDPLVDRLNLTVYPLTYAPPMVGFLFTFDDEATSKWGSLSLFGMTPGSTSEYGSLSFWGTGCNHSEFSSQTHEAVVNGFAMSRFVASFTQTCTDTPNDSDTKIRGIFIYDNAGLIEVPAYLANSQILTPSVPEPDSTVLGLIGLASVGLFMSRRRQQ